MRSSHTCNYLRAGEVRDVVGSDPLNMEWYAKEFDSLLADAIQAPGQMFEEERMRA